MERLSFLSMKGKNSNSADFLTVDEAAQLVGLTHWTIRVWLHKGRLTRYKSASRTVVSRTELLDLVKPTKIDPAKESARQQRGAAHRTAAPTPKEFRTPRVSLPRGTGGHTTAHTSLRVAWLRVPSASRVPSRSAI